MTSVDLAMHHSHWLRYSACCASSAAAQGNPPYPIPQTNPTPPLWVD